MNKKLNLLSLILCILWMSNVYSQEVRLELKDAGLQSYQQIFISDFDFLEVGGSKELFDLNIEKSSGAVTNAMLTFTLEQNGEILARIVSDRFNMPDRATTMFGGQASWNISNQQLSNGSFNFDGEGDFITIEESGLSDNAQDLKDDVMATSQLPTGIYILKAVLVYDQQNNPVEAVNEIIIHVSNPTLINLVAPGMLINSGFKYEVYTENPLFQWNGNSGEYEVIVFKKRNDFDTIDDILNSVPVWESERLNTLSVQYPVGSAVPLEYGSDYIWQVRSFVNTSSGENVVKSELWKFTVVDPSKSNLTQETIAKQELEQILRQLLGDKAETIIRQINDYNLTSMRVNGSGISIPELYQILEKYRDQEHNVYDLILRSSN